MIWGGGGGGGGGVQLAMSTQNNIHMMCFISTALMYKHGSVGLVNVDCCQSHSTGFGWKNQTSRHIHAVLTYAYFHTQLVIWYV